MSDGKPGSAIRHCSNTEQIDCSYPQDYYSGSWNKNNIDQYDKQHLVYVDYLYQVVTDYLKPMRLCIEIPSKKIQLLLSYRDSESASQCCPYAEEAGIKTDLERWYPLGIPQITCLNCYITAEVDG